MPARRMGRSISRLERTSGERLDPWEKPRHLAFIQGRTWELAARPGQSRPTIQIWRRECACCSTTAKLRSITTTWRVTTGGWMRFRQEFFESSLVTCQYGTVSVETTPRITDGCFPQWTAGSFHSSRGGVRRCITCTGWGLESATNYK